MTNASKVGFVVIGSNDRQLEELLRQGGMSVSSQPVSALAGLAHGHSTVPEALIVDLRDTAEVPEALGVLKRRHPQLGVVIVGTKLDPALMLDAMRAGVTEWIAEPVTAAALTEAVHRVVVHRAGDAPLGQIFAFVGAKGGVGTTTVAVNVATSLCADQTGKCLLVDLHLANGDAAVLLGAEPRFSTADVLGNIHRLDEAFLKGLVTATTCGVHLLASSDRPSVSRTDAQSVQGLIQFAAQTYAYVVLDVPRSDLTMLESLEMANSIIVVANQEVPSVRRAGALATTLRQRYGHDRVGVVINRFDQHADVGIDDVERVTGGRVRHLIPSDYRTALDGLNRGQPLVVQNHSRLAGALSGLARVLSGAPPPQSSKEPRQPGFLGRLRAGRS